MRNQQLASGRSYRPTSVQNSRGNSWTSQLQQRILRLLRLCYVHSDARLEQRNACQNQSSSPHFVQAQIAGDRTLYEASSDCELLRKIRDAHPYPEISEEAFMRAWAQRLNLWDGSKISTNTVQDFLADLQRHGTLRVWGDPTHG